VEFGGSAEAAGEELMLWVVFTEGDVGSSSEEGGGGKEWELEACSSIDDER